MCRTSRLVCCAHKVFSFQSGQIGSRLDRVSQIAFPRGLRGLRSIIGNNEMIKCNINSRSPEEGSRWVEIFTNTCRRQGPREAVPGLNSCHSR